MGKAPRAPAPPFIPDLDRPAKLPRDALHLRLEEAIKKLNPPRVRYACRNALNHLRKAWTLHPIDADNVLGLAMHLADGANAALSDR